MRVEGVVEPGGDGGRLVGPAELGDVGAGGEDPFAAGDHHRAGRVGGQRLGSRPQLGEQRRRQRVDLAVVEGDDGHAVVAALEGEQRGVGHPAESCRPDPRSTPESIGGRPVRRRRGRASRRPRSRGRSPCHHFVGELIPPFARTDLAGALLEPRATISRSSSRSRKLAALGELARTTPRSARWATHGVPELGDARRRSVATVDTIGGRHASWPRSERSSICSRSRRVSSTPRAVGLVDHEHVGDLHQPGLVGLHAVAPARVDDDDGGVGLAGDLDLDLTDADRLDEHPRAPTASSTRTASGVASARPPRWPRVAIERMNTPGSVAWSCIRTRSPRIAPPVNGDDGSMASTATSSSVRAQVVDERARQRGLAGAGRTGDARPCSPSPPWRIGQPADRRGRRRRRARPTTAAGPARPDRRRSPRSNKLGRRA